MKFEAKLDKGFKPMILVFNDFVKRAKEANGEKLVIGIERNNGFVSTFEMIVFPDGTGHDEENLGVVERIVKTLLWVKGGYKIIIAGSKLIFEGIAKAYAADGARAFDNDFMSGVYEKPFECVWRPIEEAPVTEESATPVGRHLDGCRIGFDAGGSDRKVSAVINGESVYSEEVVWFPKINSDPQYQYDGILSAMKSAAEHLPRVDAIGVSSAGVYVDNRIMVASLFLKVSKEDFEKRVKNMYIDIAKEFGENVPLEVANDGDVTALAGAMDLDDDSVLGIAMGTSEAGGYVDPSGNITGWLNELAFAPVDYSKDAMIDEWSGDIGCGVKYFSQDGVKKAQNDLLIWHLFGMRSGMTYDLWSSELKKARENENATTRELVAAMAKEPLLFEPGTAYNYSLSHDVLAAVAEVITGKTFHEFLKDEIFTPLGMTDIGFHPTEEDMKRFAKQYMYDGYKFKCNEYPKTCAYRLSEKYESGGAGLFATNDEYMKVLDALANGGKAENGYQLLKPETIDILRKPTMSVAEAFGKVGYRYAHGVRVMTNKEEGQSLSPLGEFGWDGAAASYGMVDTENNISLVFTTHVLGFGRCYSEIHPQLRNRVYIGLGLDK